MGRSELRVLRPADAPVRDPRVQVSDEIVAAALDLDREAGEYFHLPWPALDAVVGGMPPGEVCYVAAFSGHGKTTFLSTLTDCVFETTHAHVYYMGLESRPKTLRTHWACKRLGYDAGDVLSGAYLQWPNAQEVRAAIHAELRSQLTGEKFERVRFCPTPHITAAALRLKAREAKEFGADLFVIDHVDHIGGGTKANAWEQSVEVNHAILDIAQDYGFVMLPATQLNNDAVRGNRAALHVAPQPQFVKMGGHKREVATWMLGLYKPLRIGGVDQEALKRFNATGDGFQDVLEPNTMAVSVMKHRFYGNREGARCYLRVEHGRVLDANQDLYKSTRSV